jgi:two-component system sensor histidine kinase UhpB
MSKSHRTPSSLDPAAPSSAATQEAVEQERLRLAHDLHDDLGSLLVATKMAMAPLLNPAQKNIADLQAAALRADGLLDQAIGAMRRVLHDLHPPELALGLVAALQQMSDDYSAHAVLCDFSSNQAEIDAGPETTLGILRICREALTNISKHAAASRVVICLTQQSSAATDRQALTLDIIDDGRGYSADAPAGASIERRVRALGGMLERRPVSVGNHLHIRIPIPFPADAGSS